MSRQKKEILEKELNAMQAADVVEECESPWVALIVLVPKKADTVQVYVNYQCLNKHHNQSRLLLNAQNR